MPLHWSDRDDVATPARDRLAATHDSPPSVEDITSDLGESTRHVAIETWDAVRECFDGQITLSEVTGQRRSEAEPLPLVVRGRARQRTRRGRRHRFRP